MFPLMAGHILGIRGMGAFFGVYYLKKRLCLRTPYKIDAMKIFLKNSGTRLDAIMPYLDKKWVWITDHKKSPFLLISDAAQKIF